MLDVKRLYVFLEIVRRGSFSGAAEALSVSPSAVSQQIAGLELQVGARLFHRRRQGPELTDAGHVLLDAAERVVGQLEDARAELDDLRQESAAELRLGSFSTATSSFVAGALMMFRAREPGVNPLVIDGSPDEQAQRLRDRDLDLALVYDFDFDFTQAPALPGATVEQRWRGLELLDLFEDDFLLVTPAEHHFARQAQATLTDLDGARIMCPDPLCTPWSEHLSRLTERAGVVVHFDQSYATTDYLALQGMLAATGAVSFIPRLALGTMRADLVAVPAESAPVRRVRLARRTGGYQARSVGIMVDVLRELVEDRERARASGPRGAGI